MKKKKNCKKEKKNTTQRPTDEKSHTQPKAINQQKLSLNFE
jgi:hypothetical protein